MMHTNHWGILEKLASVRRTGMLLIALLPNRGDVKSWFNGPIEGKRRETPDFTIPILPPI
jgi:hypothetical protein